MNTEPTDPNSSGSPTNANGQPIDIVDSQIHLFRTIGVEGALAAMDALRIRSALIDEFWTFKEGEYRYFPGYLLPNKALRHKPALSEHASNRYPDRLSYLIRVDPRDPEIDKVIHEVSEAPHARGIRLIIHKPERIQDLVAGLYRACFAAAERYRVPIFIITHGNSRLLEPHIQEFPGATVILDHVGVARTPAEYEDVLRLAKYANVALKWCHAEKAFGATSYPFPETTEPLRQAINAFGAERIMWASDFTIREEEFSWSDRLFHILRSSHLSEDEKRWILGGSARKLLNWPQPEVAWTPYRSMGPDFTDTNVRKT